MRMAVETAEEAYARGQANGQVMARLDNHETRLGSLDVAIAQIGPQIATLTSAVQDLRSDLRERETTAQALEKSDDRRRRELDEADEARRKRADEAREALGVADDDRAKLAAQKFLPITRLLAYATAVEGALVVWLTYQQATGRG